MRPLPPGYNPKPRPRPRPRPLQPGPAVDPRGPIPGMFGNLGEFGPRQYYEQTGQLPPGMNMEQLQPFLTPGTQQPRPINFPPELINPVRPSMQQPIPRDYGYGNQLPPGLQQPGTQQPVNFADIRERLKNRTPGTQQPIRNIGTFQSNVTPFVPITTSPFNSTPIEARGGMRPDMQINSAPLQLSYGGRAGYQMGGIMGLENNQEEPIFPRLETLSQNLGQAEQTLGAPSNDQFNLSSITTAITGRPQMNMGGRMGYQEGDIAMMQPEGIMNALPPEAGGMMQAPMQDQMMEPQMQGQLGEGDTALLTIIQLLIERGVPPEQAEQLARQILQIFAQGGQPAVEEFANQLRQQEQSQAMASGGIVGYARRREYGFGSFVSGIVGGIGDIIGGVADAVSDVISSPIGQIALTMATGYFLGPAGFNLGAGLTSNAFLAGAINAGTANLLVQGITTGEFNPKQALLAGLAGGVTSGLGAGEINPNVGTSPGDGSLFATGADVTPPQPSVTTNLAETFNAPNIQPNITPNTGYTGLESDVSPMIGTGSNAAFTLDQATLDPAAGAGSQIYNPATQPSMFEEGLASIQKFGTNLMTNPLGTLGEGFGSAYKYAKENIGPLSLGALAGAGIRPQAPGESDEEYQRYLAEREAEVAEYYNLYEGYMNPKKFAANGGRIGFEYGSMPMGEPRENPVGIMELDYRAKGGFVPPIGIKEKADDIPAMLSNNEFVFTADAVRNAGGGNVNKGAQRMYGLMKQLEAGGVV